jgi:hypothetical protein
VSGVSLSDDNYLLIKSSINQRDLKRTVDHMKHNVPEPFSTKENWTAHWKKMEDKMESRIRDEDPDKWAVMKLYAYTKREEFDTVVYYDNIRALAGSSGYLLIRDGYIINQVTEKMS